jgi:adenylosuccinate lyase
VERVALPDASLLACYLLRKATGLAAGLVINADRAKENLTQGSYGLVFSQSVLLALVSSGLTRDAAYRIVQRDARAAWEQRRAFREVLVDDPEMTLSEAQLNDAFDLTRALRHTDRFRDALEVLA